MHDLGPSRMEHQGMYENQQFEGNYETYPEVPLEGVFGQEMMPEQGYEYEEMPESSYEQFETYPAEYQEQQEWSGELGPNEELALATEMLEVQNAQELDRFIGKLVRRAAKGASRFVRSPAGRALGGVLRTVAARALPLAAQSLGTAFGGPLGGMIGSQLANMAGQALGGALPGGAAGNCALAGARMLGLQLEGQSNEETQFEVSRQFVRFAFDAARRAAAMPHQANPNAVATQAVRLAAQQYAPGLLSPNAALPPSPLPRLRRGTWIRRGRTITLYGV